MRFIPLLIVLLSVLLSAPVCLADMRAVDLAVNQVEVVNQQAKVNRSETASTIPAQAASEAATVESQSEGSAAEQSSTAADSFDIAFFIVLSLGIGGLIWMRRQSQLL